MSMLPPSLFCSGRRRRPTTSGGGGRSRRASSAASVARGLLLFVTCCHLSITTTAAQSDTGTARLARSGNRKHKQRRRRQTQLEQKPQSARQTQRFHGRSLQSICSCSPRSFTVQLDFFNNCFDDTLESRGGITSTDCTIEVGNPALMPPELAPGNMLSEVVADLLGGSAGGDEEDEGDVVIEFLTETGNSAAEAGSKRQERDRNGGVNNGANAVAASTVEKVVEEAVETDEEKQTKQEKKGKDVVSEEGEESELVSTTSPNNGGEYIDYGNKRQQQKAEREEEGGSGSSSGTTAKEEDDEETTARQQQKEDNEEENDSSSNKLNKQEKKRMFEKIEQKKENDNGNNDNEKTKKNNRGRQLQGGGPASPIRITSVTLIEINPDGDVINVDDRYSSVNFVQGSSFDLVSVSSALSPDLDLSDQIDFVPNTQVLFMIGENARGEEIRGRFVWRYSNSCASTALGVIENDEIAWSVFRNVEDQVGAICPANGGGGPPRPTLRPTEGRTPEPTFPPFFIDTEIPTFTPTGMPAGTDAPITPFPSPSGDTDAPTPLFIDALEPTATPTRMPNGDVTSPTDPGMSMPLYYSSEDYESLDGYLTHFDAWNGGGWRQGKSRKSGKKGKSSWNGPWNNSKSSKRHKSSKAWGGGHQGAWWSNPVSAPWNSVDEPYWSGGQPSEGSWDGGSHGSKSPKYGKRQKGWKNLASAPWDAPSTASRSEDTWMATNSGDTWMVSKSGKSSKGSKGGGSWNNEKISGDMRWNGGRTKSKKR